MPLEFSKKYIRNSQITWRPDGVDYAEEYRVYSTEPVPVEEALLWFAAEPDIPKPGVSVVNFGGFMVRCRQIRGVGLPRAKRIHRFSVEWGSVAGREEGRIDLPISYPTPAGAAPPGQTSLVDPERPETWDIVVTRRPQLVTRRVADAYYMGGYTGQAHSYCNRYNQEDPPERCPIVNSAINPISGVPEGNALRPGWEVKALRQFGVGEDPLTFASIRNYENTINGSTCLLSHKGLQCSFKINTLWLQCVELQLTQVNGEEYWELTFHLAENPDGWVWNLADVGLNLRQWPGDNDAFGNVISASYTGPPARPIVDQLGRPVSDPVPLNGDGAVLPENENMVFGRWSDWKETSLQSCPVLSRVLF